MTARMGTTTELRKKRKEDALNQRRRLLASTQQQPMALDSVEYATMSKEQAFETITASQNLFKRQDPGFEEAKLLCLEGIKIVRRALCTQDNQKMIVECVDRGMIQVFLQLIDGGLKVCNETSEAAFRMWIGQIHHEIAWCLTNVAAGPQAVNIFQHPDSLRVLGQCIYGSEFSNVREQCIWCIANMAGLETDDGVEHRLQLLRDATLMKSIIKNITHSTSLSMTKTCIWALANLMQGRPSPGLPLIQPALDTVLQVLSRAFALPEESRDEVLDEIFSALRKAMMHDPEVVQFIGEREGFICDACDVCKHALETSKIALSVRVWRCFHLLCGGSDEFGKALLDHDVHSIAKGVLTRCSNDYLKKEVCLTLNCLLDAPKGMDMTISKDLISSVVDVVGSCAWSCKPEALSLVCKYLLKGNYKHHTVYICTEMDPGLSIISDYLRTPNDVALTLLALDTIEYMLKLDEENDKHLGIIRRLDENKGIDYIEDLQDHGNDDVYKKSHHIILTYFHKDEEDEEIVGEEPAVENGAFAFGTKKFHENPVALDVPENRSSLIR